MALEVTQILLNAQSPDGNVRKVAEQSLTEFQKQNLASFLLSLSAELANNEKPPASRRLAGLVLKNSLDAKDAARKEDLCAKWVALEAPVKSSIKNALLQTLSSSVYDARHTACQVIAKIAGIEIPRQEWPELVEVLLGNMANPAGNLDNPALLKQATLETLGYVCEEISSDVLHQNEVNSILTAVVQGISAPEGSSDVCLAATKALYNALDFAQTNFDNDVERNYIMRVVCDTTRNPDVRIRKAAFECLVSISSTYYDKLVPYIEEIFNITAKAVKEEEEPVALQAIEFWSSICDEEIEIQDECAYSGDSEVLHYHFIQQAVPALVPMLLETLTKQEEDQDQDEGAWNLAMAGGTCLGLVARTVGDKVVPLVVPYVQDNISKPDWRCREAATYAFGSIIEGPSVQTLAPLVNNALGFILNALKDDNNQVKDTTAWTLSRIFEFLHGQSVGSASIVNLGNLPAIVKALLESIKDAPNIAEKVCGALYFLAQGFEQQAGTEGCPLAAYFGDIISGLLSTAERSDAHDNRLRASAYETLNQIIRCSTDETSNIIVQLLPVVMSRLGQTMQQQALSLDDKEKQGDQQALLCGVLQVIIQKLGNAENTRYAILQSSDQIMSLFLQVFACRSATVHEEAMLAIGALAYVVGPEFSKYMQEFYKYLEMGLQNHEEYQVCAITVGVVGDICRALEEKILPYCDGIMTLLLKDLSSGQLHRSVKPPIFSCFGDIALAIGPHFEKYLLYAMPMLQGAAEFCAHTTGQDDEMIEYSNQLRNGIFEAYSGILQGFKNSKPDLLLSYVQNILQFIEAVSMDKERDDSVSKSAAGVLGDVADTLGSSVAQYFQSNPFYNEFISACLASEDVQVKETAGWASSTIKQLLMA